MIYAVYDALQCIHIAHPPHRFMWPSINQFLYLCYFSLLPWPFDLYSQPVILSHVINHCSNAIAAYRD